MSHLAVPVHYDWSVMAQRVLFQRTRIAFEAARENGIDGTFLVSESHGLLVAMTTAQGLGFLNTVTILDDASVAELPGILQEFRTAGIGDPTIVVPDDDPARAAVLESLGLQPVGTRPLAFLGLQPGLPYPRPAGGETLRIRPVETHQDHALLIDILLAGYGASPEVARFIRLSTQALQSRPIWRGWATSPSPGLRCRGTQAG